MLYETVVNEINAVRAENGLSSVEFNQSTSLEKLGLDSLMYTVLTTRLEEKLGTAAFKKTNDNAALPVDVGDLLALFGSSDQVLTGMGPFKHREDPDGAN